MRSIKEVSELSGVSRRTLQYYDRIGLLKPTSVTQAGYRLYDDEAIETLQQILLYRELQFPLKDIRRIMQSSDFDRNRALEEQIELLTMKKEHLDNLILFARGLYGIGVKRMDFSAFDTRRLDEYIEQAKKNWDKTKEYQEFEQKQKGRSKEDDQRLEEAMMQLFVQFGEMKQLEPGCETVQKQVQKLRDFITEHFYACSPKVLLGLAHMYAGGGSMNENIDAVGGEGTGVFCLKAIEAYAKNHKE